MALHSPWPEQSLGHVFVLQSTPLQPAVHWHVPWKQLPWYEQSFGHAIISHADPLYPGKQWHVEL